MSDFDIRRINLNLLPALEALLETRSVSAAARRTHVSQSAMSHSLARLREALGDPLLVPSGRSLVLSPRAARIREGIPAALDALERTVAPARPFSPAHTRRTFRVATLDYFEFVMLGHLLAYLRAHAPGAELWIERFTPASVPALAAGEIDVALVGDASIARQPGLCRAELFQDPFTVMLRRAHPAARRRTLTLDAYLAHPHVVVTVEGRMDGAVDRALERVGARRNVAVRVPHFATAPLAVLESDAICTIATSVALRAQALHGVALRPPPIELPSVPICAVWSKRVDGDEEGRWFRDIFLTGRAAPKRLRALMTGR
ncbi:MAG: LysR family transcriptional regulator [Minicystis sp.]